MEFSSAVSVRARRFAAGAFGVLDPLLATGAIALPPDVPQAASAPMAAAPAPSSA